MASLAEARVAGPVAAQWGLSWFSFPTHAPGVSEGPRTTPRRVTAPEERVCSTLRPVPQPPSQTTPSLGTLSLCLRSYCVRCPTPYMRSVSVTPATVGAFSTACFPRVGSHLALAFPLSESLSFLLIFPSEAEYHCFRVSVYIQAALNTPVCCGNESTHSFPSTFPFLP